MYTLREKQLEQKYSKLQVAHSELKEKYDLLCSKLKRNANNTRNEEEDNAFLRNYGKNGGYWE